MFILMVTEREQENSITAEKPDHNHNRRGNVNTKGKNHGAAVVEN